MSVSGTTQNAERVRDAARLAARFAAARVRGRPFILSHLLTARCNARCPTCLWRAETVSPASRPGPATPSELTAAETLALYATAGEAGLAELVVWGGEPTLREDLPRLVHGARDSGLLVTLISNGWLLPERWVELRGAVDTLILSLDDVGPVHDRLRGIPGLYTRIRRFVEGLDDDPLRPRLLLNTVLSTGNRGALARLAPIAREWGAGLYFCPMEVGQMTQAGFEERRGRLALSPVELREAARQALALRADGYPLLSTEAYLHLLSRDPELTEYTCRVPAAILTVEADGTIRDCLRRDRPLADVRDHLGGDGGLEGLFELPRYREMVAEGASCTACNNPDVVETSWLWDLEPAMLRKVVQLAAL